MEVASKRWIQLTHDIGRCDFPSWSPDGRHIAFANSANGRASDNKVMTMLRGRHPAARSHRIRCRHAKLELGSKLYHIVLMAPTLKSPLPSAEQERAR